MNKLNEEILAKFLMGECTEDELIGNVWGRKLALSAPAPGYKEVEVCL